MSKKTKMPKNWGVFVRAVRNDRRLTQAELAEEADLSFTTVSRWENDWCEPSRVAAKMFIKYVQQLPYGEDMIKRFHISI